MNYDLYVPYMELLWQQYPASIKKIAEAGFFGIECHLIGGLRSTRRINAVRKQANAAGLSVRWHQGWSWETGQRAFNLNRILRLTGQLVKSGQSLRDQLAPVIQSEVVVYGNHAGFTGQGKRLYQTASEHRNGQEYAGDFERFVQVVKDQSLPVVFDTQHVLEWMLDVHGVDGLPRDSEHLLELSLQAWKTLQPYVREIHLCDFNPALGRSAGRNLRFFDGIFPLHEFCRAVRESGWSGIVTPEVKPGLMRCTEDLRDLRDCVHQLFKP